MNRRLFPFVVASKKPIAAVAVVLGLACAAHAQSAESFDGPAVPGPVSLPRQFPDRAEKGLMRFVDPPVVMLGDERLYISPGARIRDPRNMMVHMSQLKGRVAQVMYLRDAMQQIGDIWLLSDYEASQPSPRQKREQLLRMDGYDPASEKIDTLLPYGSQPRYKY